MTNATIFQDVFNFTATISQGFTATITPEDENKQPIVNGSGFTAQMQLTRTDNPIVEFTWTSAAGQITFGPQGSLIVNVPNPTPSVWISPNQQYPYQTYTYTFYIYDANKNLVCGFTGGFVIYQI